jgi:hypothetical protein
MRIVWAGVDPAFDADYSTTVDVYSHLSTERSRAAAARVDSLLKSRRVADEVAQ